MNRRFIVFASLLGLISAAEAEITVRVDILTPEDGETAPPGLIVVDVLVDVSESDLWTSASLRVTMSDGASLLFAEDPNAFYWPLVNPGVENRYKTSVSHPSPRTGDDRYQASRARVDGSYCAGNPFFFWGPTFLNVSYSPEDMAGLRGRSGAIARIAIDPGACPPLGCGVGIFPLDQVPSWATRIIARCEAERCENMPGTAVTSLEAPTPQGVSWVIAIKPDLPCPYDLNFDCSGVVDLDDLATLLRFFGHTGGEPVPADINRDGAVDYLDLSLLLSHFGDPCCVEAA